MKSLLFAALTLTITATEARATQISCVQAPANRHFDFESKGNLVDANAPLSVTVTRRQTTAFDFSVQAVPADAPGKVSVLVSELAPNGEPARDPLQAKISFDLDENGALAGSGLIEVSKIPTRTDPLTPIATRYVLSQCQGTL